MFGDARYHVTFHTRNGRSYHACSQAGYDTAEGAAEGIRRVTQRGFAGNVLAATITDDLPAYTSARVVAHGTIDGFWNRTVEISA